MTIVLSGGIDTAAKTVVLIGDAAALLELAALLRRGNTSCSDLDPVDTPTFAPASQLVVDVQAQEAMATAIGEAITIVGTATGLARLADEIDLFVEYNDLNVPGMHMHLLDVPVDLPSTASAFELVVAGPVPDE